MPLSLVLLLLLVALLFLLRGHKKTSSGLLLVALAGLWLASTPFVARGLYGALEARFPPLPLANVPAADCTVLLGGAIGSAEPPRVDVELSDAIDRVYKTAQIFRAGKTRYVIASAGNQPWSQSPWVEADLIKELLVEWGVSTDAIFLEGSSRNTRENALYAKNLVNSIHCETTLLVTSAAHMPRAVAAFRGAGISVTPVSTDVRVTAGGTLSAAMWLPDAGALAMTSDAIREWIGQWVYAAQGWS